MRTESEDGIGGTLAVFIQPTSGRIKGCLAGENVTMFIERQISEIHDARLVVLMHCDRAIPEDNDRAFAGIHQAQDGMT